MPDVSLYMAFAAGLISFLSPCVLPLVPGYISFISGVSFAELKEKSGRPSFLGSEKRIILINSIFFVAGFSIVFILLGASATWLGAFLSWACLRSISWPFSTPSSDAPSGRSFRLGEDDTALPSIVAVEAVGDRMVNYT